MLNRHVSHQLAALIDGELARRKAEQVEFHIARCAQCREEREQVQLGMQTVESLPQVKAPDAIWTSIEAALPGDRPSKSPVPQRWRFAIATAALLALLGGAYWSIIERPRARWQVLRIDGSPSVGSKHISGAGQVEAGQWIETDSASRAAVQVGQIGSVEVEPGTRLRVVAAQPGEHRLALVRGEIRAKISAPPKLFFVDTASGTAIDLGCEYTLNTDEDGLGLLQVTKGWVSLQGKGLESLVPAGASCRTHPNIGPGIPYFDDAPQNLKQALESFGIEKSGNDPLTTILSEARVRDTLTLWHLLQRVEVQDRARVYERMASLTPVPAGVSRERALELDPETLKLWKDELAWKW
jgi:anti-sigma factor RsiW